VGAGLSHCRGELFSQEIPKMIRNVWEEQEQEQERDRERERRSFWVNTWVAVASSYGCVHPKIATEWADEALKALDERTRSGSL